MFAGRRGSVAYAKHLSTFAAKARIGVHDSVVIEKRDASKGVGVYLRDACDEATSLVVVPNAMMVSAEGLRGLGAGFPLPANVAQMDVVQQRDYWGGSASDVDPTDAGGTPPPNRVVYSRGFIASLLGCRRDMEWVELAWRVGMERCSGHSFWWGWLDALPSIEDYAAHYEATEVGIETRFPELSRHWHQWHSRLVFEVDDWYTRLEPHVMMPPKVVFDWAVRVVLSRGTSVIQPVALGGGTSDGPAYEQKLGILPVADGCNTAATSFIEDFEGSFDAFLEKAGGGGAGSMSKMTSTFLQVASRDNPYFFTPTSPAGKRAASTSRFLNATTAAQISLPNAVVEVALTWNDLPRWYQDIILASTLEASGAATIGMTSTEAMRPSNDDAALNGIFPAFVLTLMQDVGAGGEVLVHYEAGREIEMVPKNSKADHAMGLWARYNFMV